MKEISDAYDLWLVFGANFERYVKNIFLINNKWYNIS